MKLQTLLGHVSPRRRAASMCEACGNTFTCGATLVGCWCTGVILNATGRADLRATYQRCLCRACLERLAEAGGRTEEP